MADSHYQWVILNFYAFSLSPENIKSASSGDLAPLEKRRYEGDTTFYNNSNAKIILTVDTESRHITQVDMAVPGYTCTVAWRPQELERFEQDFIYAANHIKLKNTNAYSCDMGQKKVLYKWDINVDLPIFRVTKKK